MFSLKPSLIPFVGIMYIICTTEYPQELFKRTRIDHALKKKNQEETLTWQVSPTLGFGG
jgi:hypothetical protein